MANAAVNITSPVGRLVAGSLYDAQDKDAEGKPLVIKNGPNAGQQRVDFFFAVAIPKESGHTHWAQTDWGAKIWAQGHAEFPQAAQSPDFSWKIVDGDSQVANKNGKRPCDREGYRGCWVIHLSSGFAPKIYNRDGTAPINDPGAVKLGYYIQANFNVAGNGSRSNPGVYLNHSMVALSAYGEEIFVGPDVSQAGFGAAALPAGAMATPPGGFAPAAPVAPLAAPAPVAPLAAPAPVAPLAAPAPVAVAPNPVAVAPNPVAVAPNPGFLNVPGVTPAPSAVPVPAAPPVATAPTPPARLLTTLAQGATYEQLIGAGWTDATLIQNGLMLP